MRYLTRLGVFLIVLGALFGGGHVSLAQQSQTQVSPALQILRAYRLPLTILPAGSKAGTTDDIRNADLASQIEDPAEVAKLVNRGRIDGIEQHFTLPNGAGALALDLDLFRDSAGAQADLADTSSYQGNVITPESAPSLGDASLALQIVFGSGNNSTTAAHTLGFTSGRLEVSLTALGPSGSVSQATLTPLATYLAGIASQQPPPPPSDAELALLQSETAPESILHDSYRLLIDNYLTSLSPPDMLTTAFNGAVGKLPAGLNNVPAAPQVTSGDPEDAWAQFLPAYQTLEALGDSAGVSRTDLAYGAANAMYGSLNCHTHFDTPRLYAREYAAINGEPVALVGIVHTAKQPFTILRVLPGTPAEQAGLRAGDQITAIDHITPDQTGEKSFFDLAIGEAGMPVTLTIQRPGQQGTFDITAVRQLVHLPNEEHRVLPGGIGYIEFDDFTPGSAVVNAVRKALEDFTAAGNVNSWILDLRYNSGGSELTLERMAGLFLQPNTLIATQNYQDGTNESLYSEGTPVANQKSMVILTGPATASAAEIFTEALRDQGRVTVVGSQTAGCVNGGNIFGLLDGSGVFVSEISVLAGPSKVSLEDVGVTPDESVDLSTSDLVAGQDSQLSAATALFTAPTPAQAPSPTQSTQRPQTVMQTRWNAGRWLGAARMLEQSGPSPWS